MLLVELSEWSRLGPAEEARLRSITFGSDVAAQRQIEALRGRLDIREGYGGLEITTSSFVGRVDLGPLRIAVYPKLPALPLMRLLRYAYGLRDLAITGETTLPIARLGLHDLLIAMLAAEVAELLHRGLARRPVPLDEWLSSPRGSILFEEIARAGGVIEARLPCRHFERSADWTLNRVLRAGVAAAMRMTEDRDLRRQMHAMADGFGDVAPLPALTASAIDDAERGLNRLTAASAAALRIIRLLYAMLGPDPTSGDAGARTPGFLFDMNVFFQRLLSRFLHEHLSRATIVDEWEIRGMLAYRPRANPLRRQAPTPRPDFALREDDRMVSFLDAKYRDIWSAGLPAEWLYQLAVYALASPNRASVILYASMADDAQDEVIDIRQPVLAPSRPPASVIVRPVPLPRMAALLDPARQNEDGQARIELADRLVSGPVN